MQTYRVNYNDWQGEAFRQNGKWHLVPKHLSDHLGLKWASQFRKIQDTDLSEGILIMGIPSARGTQETVTLKLAYFGAWLLSINSGKVPEEKRQTLLDMKRGLLDALERQLSQQFGLPGMLEAEDFMALPLPPIVVSNMTASEVQAAREKVMVDPISFMAARFMRTGLPASKIAPLVGRSIYWARGHQRLCRRIGLVPLPPAQQRLLDQPSLFGEV